MRSASLILLGAASLALATDVQDCSCGFLDSANGQLYTDALIVYFNESTGLPEDFYAQHYAHKKEYGWNTIYRSGSLPDNVMVSNSSLSSSNDSTWDSSSLELYIDPSTKNHLVNGASIESMRQDILYGSFRAYMRGPEQGSGGSAMSMLLDYNRTSKLEIDMINGNAPEQARITTLMNGEFPGYGVSVNYSTLTGGSSEHAPVDPWEYMEVRMDWTENFVNYTVAQNMTRSVHKKSSIPTEPLPFTFRHWSTGDETFMQGPPTTRNQANVAWVRAFFNSSLATMSTRNEFNLRCKAEAKCSVDDISLRGSTSYPPQALIPWVEPPSTSHWGLPAAFLCGSCAGIGLLCLINVFFKRKPWKTMFNGEKRYEPAELDLGQGLTSKSPYVLSFKNGSDKDDSMRDSFDSYGSKDKDISASRTSSPSDFENDEAFDTVGDLAPEGGVRRRSIFPGPSPDLRQSSIGTLPSPSPGEGPKGPKDRKASVTFAERKPSYGFGDRKPSLSPRATSGMFGNFSFGVEGGFDQDVKSYDFAQTPTSTDGKQRKMSLFAQSRVYSADDSAEMPVRDVRDRQGSVFQSVAKSIVRLGSIAPITEIPEGPPNNDHLGEDHEIDIRDWNTQAPTEIDTIDPPFNAINAARRPTMAEAVPIPAIDIPMLKAKAGEKRVNYLAGLVAFSCLGVTGIHFTLTFVPYAGGLNGDYHYKSEYWARWTVTPYLLNPIWLGPFFVTSCRFLAGGFFKKGDLKEIASKMLLRAPRLLIPAIIVAMLEYFFLEEGTLAWIEWLPSISWSQWPYIISYNNFGVFMNDILELAYLIPNAAPQIVSHYCVGVLWTVPVQLQFSYTALLATVVIRDIKNPYKRFFVYFIGIATNWYALNWGSCFWTGVMLADLQVTYKASAWLQARPKIWYPTAIFLWMVAIACPTLSLLQDRLGIQAMTAEHNIHPDFTSGKLIGSTGFAGYPLYFEPRLNTLLFAVSMQMLVETSTWFQAFFSLGFWQPIFPHAYTIYLVHGFVWWSLGSFVCVKLAVLGTPYWANLLVTALVSYTVLAIVVMLLSPLTEMTNAAACRNILRWGTQAPVPPRTTLSPFPPDLFLGRTGGENAGNASGSDEEEGKGDGPTDGQRRKSAVEVVETIGKDGKRRNTLVTINEVQGSSSGSSGGSEAGSSSGLSIRSVRMD